MALTEENGMGTTMLVQPSGYSGGGKKMIAMVGMEDTIVVDTEDALLVCAKDSAGDIKKVLEVLRAVNRTELL